MRRPLLLATLAFGLLGGVAAAAPQRPVVVELFTAQGCASCPEADRLLATMAQRKSVIALMLPVDYWDYLGWADTFAQPAFTERQRAYDHRLKVREIYTPEIVVNGRQEAAGLDKDAIDALIQDNADDLSDGPKVRLLHGDRRVRVSGRRSGLPRSDVWLMRYDPEERTVRVKTGDNKGKLVAQRDVVHELVRLGGYTGGTRSYAVPAATAHGLTTLILVQATHGGQIEAVGEG